MFTVLKEIEKYLIIGVFFFAPFVPLIVILFIISFIFIKLFIPTNLFIFIGLIIAILIIALLILMIRLGLLYRSWPEKVIIELQANPINRTDPLYEMVVDLSKKANLSSTPTIYRSSLNEVNALALWQDGNAWLIITEGLLNCLSNQNEVKGVIAHEITHIANNDFFCQTCSVAISNSVEFLKEQIFNIIEIFSNKNYQLLGQQIPYGKILLPFLFLGLSPILLFIFCLAPTLATIIKFTLSHEREFKADNGAAKLINNKKAIILALKRLERQQTIRQQVQNYIPSQSLFNIEPLLFINALPENYRNTHPPISERIEQLQETQIRSLLRLPISIGSLLTLFTIVLACVGAIYLANVSSVTSHLDIKLDRLVLHHQNSVVQIINSGNVKDENNNYQLNLALINKITKRTLKQIGEIDPNDIKNKKRDVISFLSDAKLLSAMNLNHVDLSYANLSGINFTNKVKSHGTDLKGANLKNAKLRGSVLAASNLGGANLEGANLEKAYVKKSDLRGANLARANLKETNFEGANFKKTNFINTQGLTNFQIKSSCYWIEAYYKGNWKKRQNKWIIDEKANKEFIEKIKTDKNSNLKIPLNCSFASLPLVPKL